jgi:hypothetical protein
MKWIQTDWILKSCRNHRRDWKTFWTEVEKREKERMNRILNWRS